MQLTEAIIQYIDEHQQEAFSLLTQLAQIPAPSNHEEKRAEFCKQWLETQGAQGVYIDEALNVIYPVGCGANRDIAVFMAHSDVVFPDTDPLPLRIEDGKIKCPGIGDDTANVVALMMAAKYIAEKRIVPNGMGVLLVVNAGEEGLGNLKGSKKVMADFGSRIREFISFDGTCESAVTKAVGSKRFQIEVRTEGGHSYGDFGNRNAIACLAELIQELYAVQVPDKGKTTYNVGLISGGTSVNTIAQQAQMLYEFRSDERESLGIMQTQLDAALERFRAKGIETELTLVGDRPCSGEMDARAHGILMDRVAGAVRAHYGHEIAFRPGSTDCNVPLSMGISAVCIGCYQGGGAHTREEYVEIDSLLPGLKVAFELILHHF